MNESTRRYRAGPKYNAPEAVAKRRQYHRERFGGSEYISEAHLRSTLKRYGVDTAWYASRVKACAVCGVTQENHETRLHIDHDHVTGKARGLLCGRCNLGIGQFQDNPDILLAAIAYLKRGWN